MKKSCGSIGTIVDCIFLLRPVVLIPVAGFALFGYFKGSHGRISELSILWSKADVSLFVWIVVFSLAVGCVYVLNQIADIDVDKKNSGLPLLASGIVSRRLAFLTAGVAALLSIGVPLVAGKITVTILSTVTILVGIAYSFRPFYFSGRLMADFLTNAIGFGIIAFGVGWHLAGRQLCAAPFLSAALPYFLLMCGGAISSTIPDVNGDRSAGKRTTAVAIGVTNAHCLATACIIAAACCAIATKDSVATLCSAASLPLYVLQAIHPTKLFSESTYKIGGALCMVAASCIMPLFLAYGIVIAGATWMYFRFRHGVAYPALVPRENSPSLSKEK